MRARAGVAIVAAVLTVAGGAARSAAGEPATTTIAATTSTATVVTTTTTTLPTGAAAGSTTTSGAASTTTSQDPAATPSSTVIAGPSATVPAQQEPVEGARTTIIPASGPPGTVVTLEVTGCIIGGWSANWTIVFVSTTSSMSFDDFGAVGQDGSYSVRFAVPDLPAGRADFHVMCGVDDMVVPDVSDPDFTVTEGPPTGIGGAVGVSPASGPPGTVMTVRASGCALDGQPATYSRVTLLGDEKLVLEDFGVADSTGAFSGTFIVPDWEPGRAQIRVVCALGDIVLPLRHSDSPYDDPVAFEITAASPPTPVVVRPDYTG